MKKSLLAIPVGAELAARSCADAGREQAPDEIIFGNVFDYAPYVPVVGIGAVCSDPLGKCLTVSMAQRAALPGGAKASCSSPIFFIAAYAFDGQKAINWQYAIIDTVQFSILRGFGWFHSGPIGWVLL